jgi:uncharacterized protein
MTTFKDCLENRRIIPFPEAIHLIEQEIEDAKNDVKSAKDDMSKDGFKWATIKGYYSMFHSARALLHSKGFRERGHYCLYLAIKEFFVKEKKLKSKFAEDFKNSMILREDADYGRGFSEEGAAAVIKCAEEFLKETKRILKI